MNLCFHPNEAHLGRHIFGHFRVFDLLKNRICVRISGISWKFFLGVFSSCLCLKKLKVFLPRALKEYPEIKLMLLCGTTVLPVELRTFFLLCLLDPPPCPGLALSSRSGFGGRGLSESAGRSRVMEGSCSFGQFRFIAAPSSR